MTHLHQTMVKVALVRRGNALSTNRPAHDGEQRVEDGHPENDERNEQRGEEEVGLANELLAGRVGAAADPDASPPVDSGGGTRSLRILLAEDGLVNQRVAVGLLGMLGHTVVVAGTGREAVAAAAREAFDAILKAS